MCNAPDCSKNQMEGHTVSEVSRVKQEMKEHLSSCDNLLEMAANNDLPGFKRAIEIEGADLHASGSWYCRRYGSNKMAVVEREPIMIAALFGSLEVLEYILGHYAVHGGDVNMCYGEDKSTVLHAAVASGAANTEEMVELLLVHGADPQLMDAHGYKPFDVKPMACLQKAIIGESSKLPNSDNNPAGWNDVLPDSLYDVTLADIDELCSPHSGILSPHLLSPSSSPKLAELSSDTSPGYEGLLKDLSGDTACADIKNIIYATDEFRMYSFKVRPCSRAYSHDWTECPFVHPGENARRRDPRRFHYSCVPCPDFRKGACRLGDACEYAHGVFESWLHPAQYRTRLCKDGTNCNRKVCFFAHTKEEVRPLHLSTDYGGMPSSPRPMSSFEVASMGSPRAPVSPSSPFRSASILPIAMAMSPSSFPLSPSEKPLSGTWTQSGLPSLHLPEGVQPGSRLRASSSARDIFLDDINQLSDGDGHLMRELAASLSMQARLNAAAAASACGTIPSKHQSFNKNIVSTGLDDLTLSNVAVSPRSPLQLCHSPRFKGHSQNMGYGDVASSTSLDGHNLSYVGLQPLYDNSLQARKLGHLSHLQSQMESAIGCQLQEIAMQQAVGKASSYGSAAPSPLACQEQNFLQQHSSLAPLRTNILHHDIGSPISRDAEKDTSWLNWGSPSGKPEWAVTGDDLNKFRKSHSLKAQLLGKAEMAWPQDGFSDSEVPAPASCARKLACKV